MAKKLRIHYILPVIIGIILLFTASCNSSTNWSDIEFYKIEKIEQMKEEKTASSEDDAFANLLDTCDRTLDVEVNLQFLKSDNEEHARVCKLINEQLVEIILKQSSKLSIDEAISNFIEEKKQEFRSEEMASEMYDHLTGIAEYGKEGIINYYFTEDIFTGGAHPCTLCTYFCFDSETGEFLSIDKVFPSASSSGLANLLVEKLMKDEGAKSMDELHEMGFLEMMDMFVSTNFALREDSIEFYYNVYDIAPYAVGSTSIKISYESAAPYISNKFQ